MPGSAEAGSAGFPGAELVVTVARSSTELSAILPAWRELQGASLSTDPGFFATLVDHDPNVLRPHVVLVEDPVRGERALVVGRLERIRLPCRVGYRTVYAPRVRSLTVSYRGLLGQQDGRCVERAFAALREAIDAGEADVVSFRQLTEESAFQPLADEVEPRVCRQSVAERPGTSFALALPSSYAEFLAGLSGVKRAGLRRGAKRLHGEFGDRLELRRLVRPEEIDEIFRLVAAISRTTYQGSLGRAFEDRPATRARIALGLERGWFRVWVLVLDDEPIAFWSGWAYGGRFGAGGTGYDPAYRPHGVGTFVLQRVIEDLCADPEVHTFELGFGDADYKRGLATSHWREETRLVYARRLRPIRINLTRSVVLAVAGNVRRQLDRLGLSRHLRTTWRRRLVPERTGTDGPPGARGPNQR